MTSQPYKHALAIAGITSALVLIAYAKVPQRPENEYTCNTTNTRDSITNMLGKQVMKVLPPAYFKKDEHPPWSGYGWCGDNYRIGINKFLEGESERELKDYFCGRSVHFARFYNASVPYDNNLEIGCIFENKYSLLFGERISLTTIQLSHDEIQNQTWKIKTVQKNINDLSQLEQELTNAIQELEQQCECKK